MIFMEEWERYFLACILLIIGVVALFTAVFLNHVSQDESYFRSAFGRINVLEGGQFVPYDGMMQQLVDNENFRLIRTINLSDFSAEMSVNLNETLKFSSACMNDSEGLVAIFDEVSTVSNQSFEMSIFNKTTRDMVGYLYVSHSFVEMSFEGCGHFYDDKFDGSARFEKYPEPGMVLTSSDEETAAV
jgi:hypothetical protein